MSVIVGNETRLCVSGITGSEGTFHTLNNKRYGTNVVSGVTPGKGGQDVEGIPVFNTFHAAVDESGANTAMIFVPPPFAADAILEAKQAGVPYSTYSAGWVGLPGQEGALVPGQDYLTVVGEDLCALGKSFAQVINDGVGSGTVGLMGGTPGNALSAGWQKCYLQALNSSINTSSTFNGGVWPAGWRARISWGALPAQLCRRYAFKL